MTSDTRGNRSPPMSPGAATNPFDSLSLNSVYNNSIGMSTPPRPTQSTHTLQQPTASNQQQQMMVTPISTSRPLVPTGETLSYQQQQVPNMSQQMNPQCVPHPYAQQQQSYQQAGAMARVHVPVPTYHGSNPNGMSPPVSPLKTPTSPFLDNASSRPFATSDSLPPIMPGAPPAQSNSNTSFQAFDVFVATNAAPAPPAPVPETPAPPNNVTNAAPAPADDAMQSEVDFWSDMGFGVSETPSKKVTDTTVDQISDDSSSYSSATSETGDRIPIEIDGRGLPKGGEYYNARVTTDMLGAIFSSGRELRSTLYSAAGSAFVDSIGDRAVVSFTIDNSAADTAGISLGHVLLKVNGQEVKNTDDAVRLVGESPRPLTMEFYSPPNIEVVKTESMCMVKYDTNDADAPVSHVEWKPKYVVAGDMLGQPHVLYMYRSKLEYDVAVREAQTPGRKLSVKVKQFDIRGAKIVHEKGYVKYPNKEPWYYFAIIRPSGLPIRISATSEQELKPIYNGVMNFLDHEERSRKSALEERRRATYSVDRRNSEGYRGETYY